MNIATNQAVQNLILTYLEDHPDFLETIKQKFVPILDDTQLPLVDEETEKRIGYALENFKHGEYITVNSDEDVLSALGNFDTRLQEK